MVPPGSGFARCEFFAGRRASSARAGRVSHYVAVAVLYDAAFATLAFFGRTEARRAIMQLTLIAGFASTIFWPLTGWLVEAIGWRHTYGGFALLHLLVALPLRRCIAASLHRDPPARGLRRGSCGGCGRAAPTTPDRRRRAPRLPRGGGERRVDRPAAIRVGGASRPGPAGAGTRGGRLSRGHAVGAGAGADPPGGCTVLARAASGCRPRRMRRSSWSAPAACGAMRAARWV